jgi:FkbM family methyltransferase
MTNKIYKICKSLIKIVLPAISNILIWLKLNRRVINFLHEKSYNSNNKYNFVPLLNKFLKNKKIIALDVGAQGGFNSDNFFSEKYNPFFEDILIEPIKSESEKLKGKKLIINKGLWSKKEIKKLYILDNRLGSSSMYEPDVINFDLHNIKNKDFNNYKVTRTIEIECDTLANQLAKLNINNLDYLKIDTQGAELEILKGIGNFRPLLIKIEAHFFSMYKNTPGWHQLTNLLYELNYVLIDWKGIGSHNTRIPAEADMIFIPNFNNEIGMKLIRNNKEVFISLMLIFGQLKLLQILMKRLKITNEELKELEDQYFN